jgi:hypothetical protein
MIKSKLKALFFATLVLGAVSYYIIYQVEDYCTFSSCTDLVPKMQEQSAPSSKQAPTNRGPKELSNGR